MSALSYKNLQDDLQALHSNASSDSNSDFNVGGSNSPADTGKTVTGRDTLNPGPYAGEFSKPGVVRTIYDPTAGTGGMLSVAGEYLAEHNPHARLTVFGQELNPESYAICKADMLIKGQDVANITFGNTLSEDGHSDKHFDYMLSNPPFGVEWKKVEKEVRKEHEQQG